MIAGVKLRHVLSVVHSYNKTNCQRQLQSPVSDQCYFYSKCNKNASKSINYYSIFFNFKFFYIKEWYFLKTKSDQNIYQNAPDWVNHFKIFSGSMPPNHVSCV